MPLILMLSLAAAWQVASVEPESLRLEYVAHYSNNTLDLRHLMGVEPVLEHHAIVSADTGLCLIDLDELAAGTGAGCEDRVTGLDTYGTVTSDDGFVYANLRRGGFAIVQLDPIEMTLSLVGQVFEPRVYFETMVLDGDRLYVPAHAYGLRIYDLADPAQPTLLGSLTDGLTDAFAVAISGATAYVADGAGGLKIIDITDETAPSIVAGEDASSAEGTSESVVIFGTHVYVAAGGAGVAVYDAGDLQNRTLHETPICARRLALVGDHLAVADIGGLELFAIESDGSLTHVASERARFRFLDAAPSVRLWHGVAGWGGDLILAADWNTLDLYRIVNPGPGGQPELTASTQRVRLAPGGGNTQIEVYNQGTGPLWVDNIEVTQPTFVVDATQALLQPGESLTLGVDYLGGNPGQAIVFLESDDPDEDPLPVQVFGETGFLDPGESATPFTLESWTLDHETGDYAYESFDLASYSGKVVFFHVFASW